MSVQDGMWAVLFTDLVDSTAQRARLGDVVADELRRDHDTIVGDAVAQQGGSVVKGTGDGMMCAFTSAASAHTERCCQATQTLPSGRVAVEVVGLRTTVAKRADEVAHVSPPRARPASSRSGP